MWAWQTRSRCVTCLNVPVCMPHCILKSCAIPEGQLATGNLPHSFCLGDKNLIILSDIKKKEGFAVEAEVRPVIRFTE